MSLSANDLAGARWRSVAVRSFRYHLMTYVLVSAMLVVIDLGRGDGRVFGLNWALWIILFWGIGVVGQLSFVFLGEERMRRVETRGPHARRWVSASCCRRWRSPPRSCCGGRSIGTSLGTGSDRCVRLPWGSGQTVTVNVAACTSDAAHISDPRSR